MRSSVLICSVIALGAAGSIVACATSEGEVEAIQTPDSGEPHLVDAEAEAGDAETTPDSGADDSKCSAAGWCKTTLPDEDLTLKDVWPVGDYAFAIAESPTLGIKILEWSDAAGTWTYIDDGTQNTPGSGTYAGRLWAPSENELYGGVGPGYVFHGKRPAPGTAWSWTRHQLEDNSVDRAPTALDGYANYWKTNASYPALGVWGTSASDVYAWYTNTIYHRKSVDGGAPEWVAEYIADRPASTLEQLIFLAAAGTGPDDIWFAAARSQVSAACAVLVRKTAGTYRTVADGVLPNVWSPCSARPGTLLVGGAEGWLVDIHAVGANQIVGLKGATDVVRVSADGDAYSVAIAPIPRTISTRPLNSLWLGPEDLWLSGWGTVVRSTDDVWDGGAYRVSTLALRGIPVGQPIYQIRGTSNTNLWAIGAHYALHKTTP